MSSSTASSSSERPAYQPLLIVLVAVCAGIVADRFGPVPVGWSSATAMAAWLAWLVLWRGNHDSAAALALLLAAAATGAAWHHLRWHTLVNDDLGLLAREEATPVCLEVVAAQRPQRIPAPPFDPLRAIPRGDLSRLEVTPARVRDGRSWRPVGGRATLIVDGHLLGVYPGDRLRVFGQLAAVIPAHNPGEFDVAHHARGDGLRSVVRTTFPDCVTVLGHASRWRPRSMLERTRQHGVDTLRRHLSPERSGLAAALLLGVREDVPPDEREVFMQTGTVHLLAISGLHVGILAAGLMFALRLGLWPRRRVLAGVVLVTVLYCLLTDARPPVVRATILVTSMCGAMYFGRRGLTPNTLALAALVVLAINPNDLFRVGTQLSFLAILALVWVGHRWNLWRVIDPLDQLIAQSRPRPVRIGRRLGGGMRRLLVASAAVWLLTMPLVMARFHIVSWVAVPMSVLLWIPITVTLLSGFGMVTLGALLPPVAGPLGWLCDGSLRIMTEMIHAAAATPVSHSWTPGPNDWWLAVFYGALGLWAVAGRWRPPRRWSLALLCGWVAVGAGVAWYNTADRRGRLDCTFISVGHGLSVLLELPDGRTMLYDAGRLASPAGGARQIAAILWSRGITHLDAVVLSHADVDHYNALPELLEKFSVGVVYVSPVMFADVGPAEQLLEQALREAGVPVKQVWQGDRLDAGEEVSIEVLHPPRQGISGGTRKHELYNDNANSIVLAVQFQRRRILLPGDLESPGLEAVTAELPYDCDVLQAPHHGSASSDPPGFAAWSMPQWVVVSGGYGRDWEQVRAAYSAQGGRLLHTAEAGAVTARIEQGELTVDAFRTGAGD